MWRKRAENKPKPSRLGEYLISYIESESPHETASQDTGTYFFDVQQKYRALSEQYHLSIFGAFVSMHVNAAVKRLKCLRIVGSSGYNCKLMYGTLSQGQNSDVRQNVKVVISSSFIRQYRSSVINAAPISWHLESRSDLRSAANGRKPRDNVIKS